MEVFDANICQFAMIDAVVVVRSTKLSWEMIYPYIKGAVQTFCGEIYDEPKAAGRGSMP